MTKLISILIILAALFVGWKVFELWEKTKNEEEAKQKQEAAAVVSGDQLPGLPSQLQQSLDAAQKRGAAGLRDWLKSYGQTVQDPRKAWIQLDYCMLVSREDLGEARRVFAEVKQRTPESSPVWPRIKQLEKTYQ